VRPIGTDVNEAETAMEKFNPYDFNTRLERRPRLGNN